MPPGGPAATAVCAGPRSRRPAPGSTPVPTRAAARPPGGAPGCPGSARADRPCRRRGRPLSRGVAKESPLRDVGGLGDLVRGRPIEPLRGEQASGRIDEVLTRPVLLALTARDRGCLLHGVRA